MAQTIRTRFLVISDTHSIDFEAVKRCGGKCKPPFPKVDVILHCGDLTDIGDLKDLEQFVSMMGDMDAELKLVIAGNHDMTLDRDYWKGHASMNFTKEKHHTALEIMTGPLAKAAKVTYLEEGLNTFDLTNGAKFTIYTSPYTPEFYDWGFPYFRNEDRYNAVEQIDEGSTSIAVNPIPDHGSVDIVMTHGPPRYILDACASGNVGCDNLLRAISRCRPQLHCFGHIHEGYGARRIKWTEDPSNCGTSAVESSTRQASSYPEVDSCHIEYGKETMMVNAAIMDVRSKPINSPWLLDLELPRAG